MYVECVCASVCVCNQWGPRGSSVVISFSCGQCLSMRMGRFGSAHVVFAFVSVITLIDTEKAQMHAFVITGLQLIFLP